MLIIIKKGSLDSRVICKFLKKKLIEKIAVTLINGSTVVTNLLNLQLVSHSEERMREREKKNSFASW